MSPARPALAVVPIYLRKPEELDVLVKCLVSLWGTAPDARVLVVDDASPRQDLVDQAAVAVTELGYELERRPVNGGFSATVNVGLRRALADGADAVLVNADIEFIHEGWLDLMRGRTDSKGRLAAIVGARLLYPNGLIQHGGVYFSLLRRHWFHRFHFGPGDLPEALVPTRCPVTGALKFIRHEALQAIGLYDEAYRLNYEDVDYCLRAFDLGLEAIYEPAVSAHHLESFFRQEPTETIKRYHAESDARMWSKWAGADFSAFVPEVL